MKKIDSADVHSDSAPYSNCIIHDNIIHIAGQDPDDKDGEVISGGIKAQTRQTLENIERLLKETNATLSDVISMNVYLIDINDFEEFNETYKKILPDPKPVRTTVAVDALATEARIEIDARAIKEERD
jgi:2-iminobutanoate/2-iminopropanoate deaminase